MRSIKILRIDKEAQKGSKAMVEPLGEYTGCEVEL